MNCYIDDFNLVRVESNDYIDTIYLLGERLQYVATEGYFQYFKSMKEIPLHYADRISINNNDYPLNIGIVTLKERFNERYRYDGALGAIYEKEKTTFRLFSPVAKEIYVVVDNKSYQMNYVEPVWESEVLGDFEGKKYYYYVRLVDSFQKVTDPYAKAGNLDYSIVVDLDKTKVMQEDFIKFNKHEDAVIYEGHIRDLTNKLTVKHKNEYLGLINEAKELNDSVIKYVKKLGMTHLQLLPLQDFIGVNENNKEESYNWGYNPQQYFALTGWYSSNPNDPYMRINEFKEVVDYAHKNKLGINVDVVYNHVYERGMFPYDKLVPGYFYRHDKNYNPSDSAGVGNDIETRNYMVRKLIVESLEYLTNTFKIDGYRFDLMGLMDIETMVEIEKRLKLINPNIMLYGEGWNMNNPIDDNLRSHMHNNALFPYYGHFNDSFRNIIKGNQHELERGFASGNSKDLKNVSKVILGTKELFANLRQTINYVECHDNYTFYDQMIESNVDLSEIKYYQDFANHLIAVSQGIAFYHAGQEMYRSKNLVENSYKSDDNINGIVWEKYESISKLKDILKIRKKYVNKKTSTNKIVEKDGLLIYTIKLSSSEIKMYLKNNFKLNEIKEKDTLIFNSQVINNNNGVYSIDKPGIYIFSK